MKFNSGAIFDKLRGGAEGSTLNIALYIGLAVFIVLAVVNFLLSATTANQAQENITLASDMRVISQQIAKTPLRPLPVTPTPSNCWPNPSRAFNPPGMTLKTNRSTIPR